MPSNSFRCLPGARPRKFFLKKRIPRPRIPQITISPGGHLANLIDIQLHQLKRLDAYRQELERFRSLTEELLTYQEIREHREERTIAKFTLEGVESSDDTDYYELEIYAPHESGSRKTKLGWRLNRHPYTTVGTQGEFYREIDDFTTVPLFLAASLHAKQDEILGVLSATFSGLRSHLMRISRMNLCK